MTALRAITGLTAIAVAETFSVTLYKYTDSTKRARAKLSTEEARALVKQAPTLIYVDTDDVADAIGDSQIRDLKSKALSVSDFDQVDVCDRALGNDAVDHDDNERTLDLTCKEARIWCAQAIAAASAQAALR